ncbi:YciI family protein [Cochlodiniinecator piscidefendens]|uniref:YciI family protein n=1 Tax=Cochlodiniinecator piscidefendens TaxID=2715756 RepID=UPI00140DF3D7|nr:YciI family protein [Cochlodiniinecator piscidefendens]
MAQFLFVYHGGATPKDEAETAEVMAAWGAWFEGMGSAVVVPGAPVGMSQTVSATGVANDGGSNPASGYTVIEATSIDDATAHAKNCPMVVNGSGSVEVAEIHEM